MDMNADNRIERLLEAGHPEVDTYEPRGLDLSLRPALAPSRWSSSWIVPSAVFVAAAVVVIAGTMGSFRAGDPQPSLGSVDGSTPIGASSSISPSPSQAIEIIVDESPSNAVLSHLRSDGDCYGMAIRLMVFDRAFADDWIDRNQDHEGWMNPLGTWVGRDPAPMVRALGAEFAAISNDGGEIWVVVERNGRLEGRQFLATTTPRGHDVWYVKDSVAPCAEVASHPATSPSPELDVVVADDHWEAVSTKLRAEGIACVAWSFNFDMPMGDGERLDERIAAAGVDSGWLTPGSEWVGKDRREVVEAFVGRWAAMERSLPPGTWMLVGDPGQLTVTHLYATRTRGDHTVWRVGGSLREIPCGARIPIEIVDNPEQVMMGKMTAAGERCFVGSDAFRLPIDPVRLDERISEAGIDGGWLSVGNEWVGEDPAQLVRAFGGTWAGSDSTSDDTWVLARSGGLWIGRRMVPTRTPRGYTVWQSWDQVSETRCPPGG